MDKTILVVEDEADLRLLISLSLKSLARLIVASSAQQALEMIRREPPSLVVLDVWLGPGLSGLEVCRALKTDEATRMVKVLLLSACGQESDVAAGLAAGADHYMIKPFSPQKLVEATSVLLGACQGPSSELGPQNTIKRIVPKTHRKHGVRVYPQRTFRALRATTERHRSGRTRHCPPGRIQ